MFGTVIEAKKAPSKYEKKAPRKEKETSRAQKCSVCGASWNSDGRGDWQPTCSCKEWVNDGRGGYFH